MGVFGPAALPADVFATLGAALPAIVARPEVQARLAAVGFEAGGAGPQALGALVASELPRWAALARAAGIEPERETRSIADVDVLQTGESEQLLD